jgi:hypothetical protein
MDLREFRDTLLRLERPEEVLRLADKYLDSMQAMQGDFILPKQHEIVKPALEYYAGDLKGWLKFVKGVRDRLPKQGRSFHPGVNEIFRRIEIRATQQDRRVRLSNAVQMAIRRKLLPSNASDEDKRKYAAKCTQEWLMRKRILLTGTAKQTKTGRVSVAEREVLLKEFWAQIDAEIENGEVPKP